MYVQTLLMLHRKLCGDVDVDYHGGGEKCKTKQNQSKCKTEKKSNIIHAYAVCWGEEKKTSIWFFCVSL